MSIVEWRSVIGFSDYEVSSIGNVRNKKTGRNLKPGDNGKGYLYVGLWRDRKRHSRYVHRIVAMAFVDDVTGFEVNHDSGIKSENTKYNLDVMTRSDNLRHAYTTGLRQPRLKPKAVRVIETGLVYQSFQDAAKAVGTSPGNISKVTRSIGKTLKGFTFELIEESKD